MMPTGRIRRALASIAWALLVCAIASTAHGEAEIVFTLQKERDLYALDLHPLEDGRMLLVGLAGAMNGLGHLREDVSAAMGGWVDDNMDISDVSPVAAIYSGEGEELWRGTLPLAAPGYANLPHITHVFGDGSAVLVTGSTGDRGDERAYCFLSADGRIASAPEEIQPLLDTSGWWPVGDGYIVNEAAPKEGAPAEPVYALFSRDGQLLQRARHEEALKGFWVHQAQDVGDGFCLAGGFWSGQADEWTTPAVVKLDRRLDIVWQWQDEGTGALNQLVETADGGLIASGWRREEGVWMVRLSAEGEMTWRNDYTGAGARYPYALLPLGTDVLLLADGFGEREDLRRLLRLAPEDGAVRWSREVSMAYNGAWPGMEADREGAILLLAREADEQCVLRVGK